MSLDLFMFYNGSLFLSWFNKVKCQLVLTKTVSKKNYEKPTKDWNIWKCIQPVLAIQNNKYVWINSLYSNSLVQSV